MARSDNTEKATDGFQEKLVHVNRVAKVVKGGRVFGKGLADMNSPELVAAKRGKTVEEIRG